MKFSIDARVFEAVPEFCVAVVAATGLDNKTINREIVEIMNEALAETHQLLKDTEIRDHKNIRVWREAFEKLGMNPNRFPSSIEALAKRVSKKPELPVINNVVNLVNAMAVRYLVPMGAHDMDKIVGNLEIRFSRAGEKFTPFGAGDTEIVEENELVYGDDQEVRTRKWVWRQGEKGKVDDCSQRVFFPIDGFYGVTDTDIRDTQEALVKILQDVFPGISVQTGWVDSKNPELMLDEI
jgi:DNA/RNA-binding domain of Phe-tRNA-synthetase-like protein